MKKIRCILLSFIILGCLSLQAKEYTIKDIPIVHLQDSTRYVSNPDSLISDSTVMALDHMLHVLKGKTGIEVAVIVVTGIESSDCFDFAVRLGKEWGVGQKGLDNGLIVLLSTEERCVQIATGYGLEGVLPDAICKRIQTQYMVKHFGNDDWDTGLLEGIRALNGYLDGTMKEELQKEEETSVERKNFNETARTFNTSIRTFPRSLLAGIFGFEKRPYFEAEEGANKAPDVQF